MSVPLRLRRDAARVLHSDVIGAYGWRPAETWRLTLAEALAALRARRRWIVFAADVLMAGVAMAFVSDAERREIEAHLRDLTGESPEPMTIEDKYGPQVAAEVAELEAQQAEWIAEMRRRKQDA